MTFLLPVVAALVTLLILPGWSYWFDVTPKVIVLLAGASLAFTLPFSWKWPKGRRLRWFWILMAIQGGTILIATLLSTHPWLSFYGSTWRRSGLLVEFAILILAVIASTHAHRDWLLRITVLAALPACVYGILQYFGIDPWIPTAGYHFGEGQFTIVRPPSTLGHAAYFATYLLYAVFAGAALAGAETNRALKMFAIATSALAGFTIVLTGTRAALLGLAAGSLLLAFRNRWNLRWMGGAALAVVMLGGFYVSPAGARLRARVHWSSEDSLGGSRLLLWRDTLRMSGARWLTGFGPETFEVEFPRHESIELASAYPDFLHESPHNIFLDALISQGIFGLLGLLVLSGFGMALARGPIGAAFVAIMVSQQFTAFTMPTQLYFYFCLAMLVNDRSLAGAARNEQFPFRYASLLAIPLIGFAGYLATGDALLATARRALDRGEPEVAAQTMERARKWNASADIYFSRRLLGQPQAWRFALDAAQHATTTAEDRQNAFVNLAALYAAQNDPDGVENCLRQAIQFAPSWFKPHWLLAQVLALEGRKPEAVSEANAAFARDGGKHPEVTQTMEQMRTR